MSSKGSTRVNVKPAGSLSVIVTVATVSVPSARLPLGSESVTRKVSSFSAKRSTVRLMTTGLESAAPDANVARPLEPEKSTSLVAGVAPPSEVAN